MTYANENEALAGLLCSHLRAMERRLRKLTPEHWDWTPHVAAPTARILAAHAWQALICDRWHIEEFDALKHDRVPEPPHDPAAMCDALRDETDRWEAMILAFTPEELASPRRQFDMSPWTVRNFVCHMIQNSIYKNGQFATLFYTLEYDGSGPYDCPFPNPIYDALHRGEVVRRERSGETFDDFRSALSDETNLPTAVLEKIYDFLTKVIARGIPLRPSDTLKDVFLLSQPENILNMYGGVPTRWLFEETVRQAARSVPKDSVDMMLIVTVEDLVRAVAALDTPE